MNSVTLSVVIPVYNEGEGLHMLTARLTPALEALGVSWEVILVDDHSTDTSPDVLRQICAANPGFRFYRLSANSGSHVAILAGLEHCHGECAVFLAADLQDPPELLEKMLNLWRQGHQTVWAVRCGREGISIVDRAVSRSFYALLRMSGVSVPPDGSDFALIDRRVINGLSRCVGANPSLFLEIARIGYKQFELPYVKQARHFGVTKWNLKKKLKAFADAFVAFSYAPMRMMSYLGLASSALGFLYAAYILFMRLFIQQTIPGFASLMVAVLGIGGVQMIMLGVLGEYLWRTLDEARHRPNYFIEDSSVPDVKERP